MKRRHALAFAAAAIVAPHSARAETTEVKLGATGLTVGNWPIMVGLRRGFFAQHGIGIDIVTAQNALDNVQALIGGSVQLVNSGPDSVVLPVEQGANLAAIASEADVAVFRVVGAKGVRSLADLRGKPVAISRTNGPDAAIFRQLLARAGLGTGDYSFITAGGSSNRVAAVASGGAVATMLVPPDDLEALRQGMTDLGFSVGRSKPLLFTVLFTDRAWARANAPVVVNVLRGLGDAMRWLGVASHKREAAQILAEYTRIDQGLAEATYDTCVTRFRIYAGAGSIDPAGFQNVLDYLAAAGLLKTPTPPVAKYVDSSYYLQSRR